MKKLSVILTLFFCLAAISVNASAVPKESWVRVESTNFHLIGNASEKEIRGVATKLEQFRDVFGRLFPSVKFNSPVPTTVIVFKSDSYYKPFKPNPNLAGYFQPGTDVNYITLAVDRITDDPFRVIFHEYVHQLVNNSMTNPPTWFNEGLAEYYSTFKIDDERKVDLGGLIGEHLYQLRNNDILPLRTLFEVDESSPYYNERNKQSVFYAESWMLVHYLLQGKNHAYIPQLSKYLNLQAQGVPTDKAFSQSFTIGYEQLEKELKDYSRQHVFPSQRATFEAKLEVDAGITVHELSEADAQAYLGDLLVHTRMYPEAEKYLQRAISLDPDSAIANSSLGILDTRLGRLDEARKVLQKAVTLDQKNFLTHYYYAYALSRTGMDANDQVSSYPAELAATMRSELAKAIELSPSFPESYALLGFVNLVTSEDLDHSIALLNRVLQTGTGNMQLRFILAQLYLRKQLFKPARQLLESLADAAPDREMRQHAKYLIGELDKFQAQVEARKSETARPAGYSNRTGSEQPDTSAQSDEQSNSNSADQDPFEGLRRSLLKPENGELQVTGKLARLQCDAKRAVFHISDGSRTIRLSTTRFESVKFISFDPTVQGEITCGPQKFQNDVVVIYRPTVAAAKSDVDGEVLVVQLVPKGFK